MLSVLSITFPIFAIIGLGFLLVRFGLFTGADTQVLGKFVVNVALPALLFNAVSQSPFLEVFDSAYVLAYTLGSLATLGIAALFFYHRRLEPSRAAVAVLGVSVPNSGYIGYGVMLLAYPAVAGKVLALNMIIENFLIIPICLVLMSSAGGKSISLPRFVAGQLMGLLRRPMVIGLLLGMVVSLFRIPVPNVMQSPITILAGVTAPLGLVYIGGSMSGLKLKGHRAVAAQIVFGKLVLHPAAIAAVILVLPVLGIGQLDPSLVAPLILSGAMPMFGIYAILAAEKGHEGMASIAMLSATVASFVTLSVLLAILG